MCLNAFLAFFPAKTWADVSADMATVKAMIALFESHDAVPPSRPPAPSPAGGSVVAGPRRVPVVVAPTRALDPRCERADV